MMTVKQAVLQALEQARGQQISGSELADSLCVTRAAVWKAVSSLRSAGIRIEAVPGGGYCLPNEDDSLTATGVQALLHTEALGREMLVLPSVSSTNTLLKHDYVAREHGFTLIAGEQTAGRGRLGRIFVSPAGTGLYCSVLLRMPFSIDQLNFITIAAATAVREAIAQTSQLECGIKWVNDILLHGKKLCGILTEATIEGETGAVSSVIVGIGINLRPNPAIPKQLRPIVGSIGEFTTPPRRAVLAAAILDRLEETISLLHSGQIPLLLDGYREHLCCIGQPVTVFSATEQYDAVCTGLDERGHLLVTAQDGTPHTLSSGEISIRIKSDNLS